MTRIILALAFVLSATIARAEPRCGPSLAILNIINQYGEVIVDQVERPGDDGVSIHWIVWANSGTGSWSLTGTRGAVTCIFIGKTSGYDGQVVADLLLGTAL